MAQFDMAERELRAYSPRIDTPSDFDDFWRRTLVAARAQSKAVRCELVAGPLQTVEVFDVTFSGFGGDPVRAWYLRPIAAIEAVPLIIEFVGYGGGRGLPHQHLQWPSAGFAYLIMDTRGQGGETADPHGAGPSVPGWAARGIESAESYYYRRVFTDAVSIIDAASHLPGVDDSRIVVAGASQGGGIALAAAGLHPRVRVALIDVPFLCNYARAIAITDANPYAEISRYISVHRESREDVLRTLGYFDGVAFAERANAPALFSVALADATCPPSTVFAAYNRYAGVKRIDVYPFNGHEGGGATRWPELTRFVTEQTSA
jgi:cephalosporin-C deacetylase